MFALCCHVVSCRTRRVVVVLVAVVVGGSFSNRSWMEEVSDPREIAGTQFALEALASKLCFRDKSQLKWRFWLM